MAADRVKIAFVSNSGDLSHFERIKQNKNPINKNHIFFSAHYFRRWLAQHLHSHSHSPITISLLWLSFSVATGSNRSRSISSRTSKRRHTFHQAHTHTHNISDTHLSAAAASVAKAAAKNSQHWKLRTKEKINPQKPLHLFYWTHLSARSLHFVRFVPSFCDGIEVHSKRKLLHATHLASVKRWAHPNTRWIVIEIERETHRSGYNEWVMCIYV